MSNEEIEMEEPEVVEVLAESGEISDELDYKLSRYIMDARGFGLTPCQPALVKLEDGRSAIKLGLDHTYLDSDTNQVMGYGIVGHVYVNYDQANPDKNDIIYITPKEDIDDNIEQLTEDVEPQPRPKGKY
jgi:hypothetical protein